MKEFETIYQKIALIKSLKKNNKKNYPTKKNKHIKLNYLNYPILKTICLKVLNQSNNILYL